MDLTSSKNAFMLFRVAKVLGQDGLMSSLAKILVRDQDVDSFQILEQERQISYGR